MDKLEESAKHVMSSLRLIAADLRVFGGSRKMRSLTAHKLDGLALDLETNLALEAAPVRCPDQGDVDAIRKLLDLMENFPSNDQRARYLLTCNWMRDRGDAAAKACRHVQFPCGKFGPHEPDRLPADVL